MIIFIYNVDPTIEEKKIKLENRQTQDYKKVTFFSSFIRIEVNV